MQLGWHPAQAGTTLKGILGSIVLQMTAGTPSGHSWVQAVLSGLYLGAIWVLSLSGDKLQCGFGPDGRLDALGTVPRGPGPTAKFMAEYRTPAPGPKFPNGFEGAQVKAQVGSCSVWTECW